MNESLFVDPEGGNRLLPDCRGRRARRASARSRRVGGVINPALKCPALHRVRVSPIFLAQLYPPQIDEQGYTIKLRLHKLYKEALHYSPLN